MRINATVDSLTGIFNRKTGIELFEDKLADSKNDGTSLVVCFIDIDGLKYANDKYGHSEGDFLIKTICDILKTSINKMDTLFRYGDNEFVVIFPDNTEIVVEEIWTQVHAKFEKLNTSGLKPYPISASHGLFEFNNGVNYTAEEILNIADEKMYLEKNMRKS